MQRLTHTHETIPKSPCASPRRRLASALRGGFFAGLTAFYSALASCGSDAAAPDDSAESSAEAKPARIDIASLPVPDDERLASGRQTFLDNCAFCHTRGTDDAPRITVIEEWRARGDKGREILIGSLLNGTGDMPPRGDTTGLSDEQLTAALDYMLVTTLAPNDTAQE